MVFNSPEFIFVFLAIAISVHFLFKKYSKFPTQKFWIIIVSSYFYGYASLTHLLLVYGSIIVNYWFGKKIERNDSQIIKMRIMFVGVLLNIVLLGYFKYTDFLIVNVNNLSDSNIPSLSIVLPLAISFYCFQQISYLVDCYKEQEKVAGFLDYCFFVLFFPQLIAGPILRYREIGPQLSTFGGPKTNWDDISKGVFVFGVGLFKKAIIADSFALFANSGFNSSKILNFYEAWASSLSYTFQIYYDFSGYSDMAIGIALIFGIRLPINFNSPYKAINIQDFWHRWHITLSRWLRDYLYIPLGGNRKGSLKTYINILLTFILAGLWHGAGWTFVIWGLLHGIALIIHRIWKEYNIIFPRSLCWFTTFIFINVTWVFFRSPSLPDAYRMLQNMFRLDLATPFFPLLFPSIGPHTDPVIYLSLEGPILSTIKLLIFLIIFPLITFIFPNTMQMIRFIYHQGKFIFLPKLSSAVILALLMFASFLTFVGNVSKGSFIYFNY